MSESARTPPVLRSQRVLEPCTMVIFGATGDLTRRKLVPALYNLQLDGRLPDPFNLVCVARRDETDESCVEMLRAATEEHSRRPVEADVWQKLAESISYVRVAGDDEGAYDGLVTRLGALEKDRDTGGNRLFYLATPPSAFAPIVAQLGHNGLNRPGSGEGWARIVVEKPTGTDLESARALNRTINESFDESDVYRIDHYLGKETVQNLLVFRFANAIFEPLWNQKYIDSVQLTVAESLGVEGRGRYFEEAGMTRDMLQNHMFQLLCLIGMEPPVSLEPDSIRDEKVKVLQALRPIEPDQVAENTVRGQYAAGVIGDQKVVGFREEPNVAPDSRTETYVGLRLCIDNWRWAGVPFYLRAGKRMQKRVTEIALQFKDVPHRLFRNTLQANTLALRIQPDEGIHIGFDAKVPGTEPQIKPVSMDFRFDGSFGAGSPGAYERLILDALYGDSTLFLRRDEVESAWSYVDRLEQGWSMDQSEVPLPEYTSGTWGPAESHVMLARDGRTWRRL